MESISNANAAFTEYVLDNEYGVQQIDHPFMQQYRKTHGLTRSQHLALIEARGGTVARSMAERNAKMPRNARRGNRSGDSSSADRNYTREDRAARIDELQQWLDRTVRDEDENADEYDANVRELAGHREVLRDLEARDADLHAGLASGRITTEGGADPGPTYGRRDAGEHWSARREDPSYVPLLRADESMVEYLKDRGRPVGSEEFRLALLGALGSGNTRALAKLARFLPEGEQTRDMLISSGGNATLTPDIVSAELIDQLRRQAVTQILGGRTIPMTSDTQKIPRITADPTVSWLAEGATVTATDATVDSVSLVARRLTGLTKVSQELVEDSDPVSVGEVLRTSFGGALAVEVDRVALKGTGTPPEPAGIRNQSGVSVNATAAAAAMSVVTERAGVLLAANVRPESIGVAVNVASFTTIMSATGSDGQFIRPPKFLENIQILPTTALAGPATGELYAGNFSELIFGVRIGLDFQVLRERYLDEGKIGFLPRIRMDVAVRHGASFALRTALSS